VARLAPAFNRWTHARSSGDLQVTARAPTGPTAPEGVLLWLGMALLAAALSGVLSAYLPQSSMLGATTWTILLATAAGLVVAHTPLARYPGAGTISGALLIGFARLFHFDLYLCGISSLAHIGGVAATPILAASYSPALVPVGILLALLGYILGTGYGLVVASVLSMLAGT
jgi:uncharacterized membrane protein